MRKFLALLSLCSLLSSCVITKGKDREAGKPGKNASNKTSSTTFNQELATKLGADQYGMKPYVIVMLTTGSAKVEDKTKMGELLKGHLANIRKLSDEGKIVVAGPFLEKNKEDYRGMFIFNTQSKEEAEQWVKLILL